MFTTSTSALLRRNRRTAAPQHELLNLACGRLRELRDEREAVRALEVREPLACERAQIFRCGVAAGLQHDERLRRLAPLRIWYADDRRFVHRRMTEQNAFDLHGRDVLAAADDHVL